jgi:uncharacterized membrane protein
MREIIKSTGVDKVRQVELLISNILRFGVIISLIVVVFGTIITFVHHEDYFSSAGELHRLVGSEPQFPHSIKAVWLGLLKFQGRAIVMAGLVLLIATPVMRVAVSILAFVYERDKGFVIITSVVLALLLFALFAGKAG